jgi:hypothetical protein
MLVVYSLYGGGLRCSLYMYDSFSPSWLTLADIEATDQNTESLSPSVTWINGVPAVAYYDDASDNIKVAVLH